MTGSRAQSPRARKGPPQVQHWVRLRIWIAGTILLLLLAAIGYRAYALQIRDADHYRDLARRQHVASVEVPAPRGAIYDAAGVELAVTADIQSVYANPRRVRDPEASAASLAETLGVDRQRIRERLEGDRHFAWIARHVSSAEASDVRALGLPGVELTPEPRRYYPARGVTGPVVGFADIDGKGLDGIELSMDELLRGVRGEQAALRDARGRVMIPERPAVAEPGASVTLTLDRTIQSTAHRAVTEAATEHEAAAGTAVVLDVETGGVLAMANYPSYDPNSPSSGLEKGARNRAITDAFEPGSILKVFLAAAALDAGAVSPDAEFDVEGGRIRIGSKVIQDTFSDEELDVGGIIRRSSNVGAVKLARRLGEAGFEEALRRYGFAEGTGIELPGERTGLLRKHERWREIEFATLSFGYGMMATPLQLTAGLAAIGNEGVYKPPRIVERAVSAEGELLFERSVEGRQIMKASTAEALLPMLASVFDGGSEGGTARRVEIDGYRAGAKTGTSLKVNPESGGYYDDVYVASFAGLAPIDDPRIAVLVLIDEPGGERYYGGDVAGPVFAEVVSETLRYLGVPPSRAPDASSGDEGAARRRKAPPVPPPSAPIQIAPGADRGGRESAGGGEGAEYPAPRMPNVRGLGISRALEKLEEVCADVSLSGTGVAKTQDPAAGTPLEAPPTCRIEFSRRGERP